MLAGIWLHEGRTVRARCLASVGLLLVFTLCVVAASRLRTAWDLSENRRNSFSAADEAALSRIRQPLRVTVFLSPEDPRLMDLDRNILAKLARILPDVEIVHAAHSRAGLFEAPGDHYGEVWYEIAGRKSMTRSTTEQIVLDNLYQLAQVPPSPSVMNANSPAIPCLPRRAAPPGFTTPPGRLQHASPGWVHLRVWS